MKRQWRFLVCQFLVSAIMVFSGNKSPGQSPEKTQPDRSGRVGEREELLGYARATWHSFETMVGPLGLPADRLHLGEKGDWRRSRDTSPTDIASYLWSTLAAKTLGLIDEAEADQRIGATLTTLARMDRDHGFFFNLYDVESATRIGLAGGDDHKDRPFLSSVDNGWLAASLIMVRNARTRFRGLADAILGPMDFSYFYVPLDPSDPIKKPGHFHGGRSLDENQFTSFYGMLNTEPRIISYIAIARHQVPPEHYYRLFRTLPADRGRQRQTPQGEVKNCFGVPVFEGHYSAMGFDFVPSWGGSMFESLMVPLFVPEEQWAPRSWGVNHPIYARLQIEAGLEVKRYGYWGFSPSCTPEGGYQTYGVDFLATDVQGYRSYETPPAARQGKARTAGRPREGVVTPHASFLAFRFARSEALANLRDLARSFPILGEQGFHDSVNLTTGEVSNCVLALDQGMIMVAVANELADDAMRRAFCEGDVEAAIKPLIAPEEFTARVRKR